VQPRFIEVHYDLITGLETQPPAILRGYNYSATLTKFCLDFIHVSSSKDLTTERVCGDVRASEVMALLRDDGGETLIHLASVSSPF
jgi:hypothetical protein